MKLLITGSRSIKEYMTVKLAIRKTLAHFHVYAEDITELVSGHAQGVDRLAEVWARGNHISVKEFALTDDDWRIYGRGAGHRRNRQMADYCKASGEEAIVCAVWDGKSPGTKGMVDYCKEIGLPGLLVRA